MADGIGKYVKAKREGIVLLLFPACIYRLRQQPSRALLTGDQLADILGNEGLLPVASDGQPFDPNVHEAVMGQPSEDHEEGTILQTFQRGYDLNGKPIRVAKVVVARQV